ncbi:hypothetical protein [Streptomyces sp. ISL-100]|uniref:hypothetical protein n=1 Tax=Streptomyces sp. ISL-100 TaxID=2819173 RepID=UPI001BECE9AB|nr:hypothetical protein [Streptomyces sp. ISL-100]MBT2399506.1 hypothetical protein [Streptomyces sp. ISL-100]
MTLSPTERRLQALPSTMWQHLTMDRDITFTIGPEAKPVDAMARATAFARRTLPMLLKDAPGTAVAAGSAIKVLAELVDITARDRHSTDVLGRVAFDGAHITVSVGEMSSSLPSPDEEPGLYLVRGLTDDIGQYGGDEGGHVTWASVPL